MITEREEAKISSPTNQRPRKRPRAEILPTSPDVATDSNSSHLVLVTSDANNESICEPLILALLQVASAHGGPSEDETTEDKIAAALARTLAAERRRHLVHVVTHLETDHSSALLTHAHHTAVMITVNDAMGRMTEIAASGARLPRTPKLTDHPLVRSVLTLLPDDAILGQKISVVLLVGQAQDDSATVAAVKAGGGKQNMAIPIFLCRPDQPMSCQTVARMLWRRLDIGRGKVDASPLLFGN